MIVLAALVTAVSLAASPAAPAPQPVTIESHDVEVTASLKLCPAKGACTLEGRGLWQRLPVHPGSQLVIRTHQPVRRVRLLRAMRGYARGVASADRSDWTFRIPKSESFQFGPGEFGWRQVELRVDYGDTIGSLFLDLARHPHGRFVPPPVDVGRGEATVQPRFCTWLAVEPIESKRCPSPRRLPTASIPVSAGERLPLYFRVPVVWARLYYTEAFGGREYATPRRDDRAGRTWSFRIAPHESRRRWLRLEIAYPQGLALARLDITPESRELQSRGDGRGAAAQPAIARRSATRGAAAAKTLVVFPGVARAFAYDAGRVAWIDSAWALRVRVVRSGATQKFLYTNPYEEIPDFSGRPRMLLQQRRLAWLSRRGRGMFAEADHVYLGTVTPLRGGRVATAAHGEGSEGSYVLGLGGDGAGFSYGLAEVRATDPDFGGLRVVGGGVFSLIGGERRRVPGAPPAIVLGRAAGRVAIAPVNTAEQRDGEPVAAGPVEIRNATTGTLVSRFSPGPVRAFAISPRIAAVLTRRQIDRYDIASGRLLGSTQVPADVADDLDVEGSRIVFRRMRSIGLLDAATGKVSTVATTEWRPAAVRIDGDTVAWAEQRRIALGEVSKKTFRARIRTVTWR